MSYDDVWLVIPLYNEGTVIGDVVSEARATFPHVVCVDDGSSDGGAARREAAGAVVVRHPVNLGQGAALQTGFEYALSRARRCAGSSPSTPTASTRSATSWPCSKRPAPRTSTSSSGRRFLDDRTEAGLRSRDSCSGRPSATPTSTTGTTRLTDAHNGLRVMSRDVVAASRSPRTGWPTPPSSSNRSGSSTVRYGESPVHILYTDYSRAKGQSLWNAVNILADLILR